MQHPDERSLKELLGNLTNSVTTLFRKEIELARAEVSEKFSEAESPSARSLPARSSGSLRSSCCCRPWSSP